MRYQVAAGELGSAHQSDLNLTPGSVIYTATDDNVNLAGSHNFQPGYFSSMGGSAARPLALSYESPVLNVHSNSHGRGRSGS